MVEIGDLPDVMYQEFKHYLSRDDFQQFLRTAKRLFHFIQKKTAYYSLTKEKSILFCQDEQFRRLVLSKVEDPSLQIGLRLYPNMVGDYSHLLSVHRLSCDEEDYDEETFDTFPLIPGLKSVSLYSLKSLSNIGNLSHAEDIHFNQCNEVEDISPLSQVKTVFIENCSKIQDFSCLRNQENVYIMSQFHLTDIIGFSKVQSLSLSDCRGLPADLSPLKGIPILNLSCCAEVNDISQLGNHNSLTISDCSPRITGYDILLHIPNVTLSECDISDVSVLRYAQSVSIRDCHRITDISSLANVKSLSVSHCERITNIDALSGVKHLTLGWLPGLVSAEGLKHHRSLEINCEGYGIELDRIPFLDQFPSMRSLTLSDMSDVTCSLSKVPQFKFLQRLSLEIIIEDFKLTGCEDINYVSLRCCPFLISLEGLGRNREVHLCELPLISDVSVLADVPIVTINRCGNIKDVSCLSKVPRLKFIPQF